MLILGNSEVYRARVRQARAPGRPGEFGGGVRLGGLVVNRENAILIFRAGNLFVMLYNMGKPFTDVALAGESYPIGSPS